MGRVVVLTLYPSLKRELPPLGILSAMIKNYHEDDGGGQQETENGSDGREN